MYVKVTNPIKDVDVLVTDSDNGNVITVQPGHTSLVLRITPMERLRILQLFGSAGLPSPEQFVPIVAGPDGSAPTANYLIESNETLILTDSNRFLNSMNVVINATWERKVARVWVNNQWLTRPLKVWTGSEWLER